MHTVKWSNSSAWPIEVTLSGNTSPDKSGPGSNGNDGALHVPQILGLELHHQIV